MYLNGRLIHRFGKVSADYEHEQTYFLDNKPFQFQLDPQPEQVIAVRYSFHHQNVYFKLSRINPCLSLTIQSGKEAFDAFTKTKQITSGRTWLLLGWFLILGVMFLLLYSFLKDRRAYLYIGIYMFCYVTYLAIQELMSYMTDTSHRSSVFLVGFTLAVGGTLIYLQAAYLLFGRKRGWLGRVVIGYAVVAVLLLLWWYQWGRIMAMLFFLLLNTEGLLIAVYGVRRRRSGAWVYVIQAILVYVVYGGAILFAALNQSEYAQLMTVMNNLVIPLCSSIFLIGEFGRTARNLQQRVVEVETLSAEKEQILTTQNETLEIQVNERTAELIHKNQELVIETALERVRSQSMAMQHSDQLQEVITVVSEQLLALGFAFDFVNFVVQRVDKGWDCYNAVPGRSISSFLIPYFDHKVFRQGLEVRQQGLDFFTYMLNADEKSDWLTHLFTQTLLKNVPEDYKQLVIDSPGYAASVVVWPDIILSVATYSGIPFTNTENAIFKRFGAVFGQAYTRFLDLQKAEAQAREAQIETALERVRSRSLAMHSSEELKEVIALVFAQLNQVDVAITDGSAMIVLSIEGSRDVTHWTVNPDRIAEATYFRMPYIDHPIHNVYFEARANGLDFVAYSFTLEEKNNFWDQAFIVSDYKYLSEETKQWLYDAPGYAFSISFGKYSGLFIDSHIGKMYSEQENDILKRFARVFEQAYVRFLDLQKAEAQAKEAQIEAALERVRSQSMAMQHSDHLLKVVHVITEQLQALDFELGMTNFIKLRANPEDGWDSYNAIPGISTVTGFYIPYLDHKLFNHIYESLKQGLDFFTYTLTPEERTAFLKHSYENTILREVVPEERKQQVYAFPGWASSVILFSDKKLVLSIIKHQSIPYTDEENAIFKRFGAVFEQAYTRFLDLQKAEEQARQAIRTASLDRVRAQIASMRTAQDLERITPLIWTELTTLQVPFFRCGVFIVNEAQHRIQAFLSTPDGQARARLNLSIEGAGTNQQLLSSWQQQRVYRERWSHDQLQQWVTSMVEEGQLDSVQEYEVVEEVKEAFSLQFIPFRQGMLYVGSQEPLSESELDLAQSLADAFSVAYARYEDFRQLEEAKVRVDAALTELKSTQAQLIQKEKLASLGELTAGIAHEIQNPLNFVNNFSELSVELAKELKGERLKVKEDRDEELENELVDDLIQNQEKINHHGKRASSIVKGMLEHSRLTTGERQLTDINQLADEYLRLAYHGFRAKNNGFSCDYELITDANLPKVEVVLQEIGRVLLNLINNGFYAVQQKTSAGFQTLPTLAAYLPKVTVSTEYTENQVKIRVKDNGNGIPEAIKDKIFQPFFTTKPTGEGTGLGLSLAYDIVTKGHGGTLEVETKEGEGTTFIVRLPLV
jgi:signal transduction histidine kinase